MLDDEGRSDSAELARSLLIILNGAIIETLIHRRSDYALAAGSTAAALLDHRDPHASAAGPAQSRPTGHRQLPPSHRLRLQRSRSSWLIAPAGVSKEATVPIFRARR